MGNIIDAAWLGSYSPAGLDLRSGQIVMSLDTASKDNPFNDYSVALVALMLGLDLELGLSMRSTVLLALTLLVATLTLGRGRTTVVQGIIHLVIFATYLFTTIVP